MYVIITLEHPPSLRKNQLMLIVEYADGGTLRQYLKENFEGMNWNIKLKFAKQIASAIDCLHENEIAHQDLVSEIVHIIFFKKNIYILLCTITFIFI